MSSINSNTPPRKQPHPSAQKGEVMLGAIIENRIEDSLPTPHSNMDFSTLALTSLLRP